MSIGEVLSHVQREFPDVSVSKIRFLESEGLVKPQRAASRYRKFAMHDVDRLVMILRLQRDSFLPLKEIKKHLASVDAGEAPQAPAVAGTPQSAPAAAASPAQQQTPPAPAPIVPVAPEPVADLLDNPSDARLTVSDLAQKTGLDRASVESLVTFGVICEHERDGETVFDGEDLLVARAARSLMESGIDARNLRVLRRIAEQEAGLYEQVVAASLRNPRPEARATAVKTLVDLAESGRTLRASYLRQALRGPLGDDQA